MGENVTSSLWFICHCIALFGKGRRDRWRIGGSGEGGGEQEWKGEVKSAHRERRERGGG